MNGSVPYQLSSWRVAVADTPAPGPADAVAATLLAAYLAYSNKDAIKNIASLLAQVSAHIDKLNTSPDPDPRNSFRREIRAFLEKARKWGNRMSEGKAKDYWKRMIDQAERMVPQD